MDWLSLGLTVLKLANLIIGLVKDRQQLEAGRDQEIAAAALQTLALSKAGKDILAKLNALDDSQVNDVLKQLES